MIECINVKENYSLFAKEYEEAIFRSVDSGQYILGSELEKFEKNFAAYLGVKHCVGLNSGTDALLFAIRALNIHEGDEVILPASTYIASTLGITENGATPVYVDSTEDTYLIDVNQIEKRITNRTKAILPVHLYGQSCDMDTIEKIAKKLSEMGSKRILIKSFEEKNKLNTLYFCENSIKWFESEKIDIKICGTGDVFSSPVASELIRGEKLENSIDKIQNLITENIRKQEKQDGLNEIQLENFKIGG